MDVVVARRRSGVGNGTVVAACELGLIPLPRDIHEPGHGVETTVGPAQVAGQPIRGDCGIGIGRGQPRGRRVDIDRPHAGVERRRPGGTCRAEAPGHDL